jgi:hypothetical protein
MIECQNKCYEKKEKIVVCAVVKLRIVWTVWDRIVREDPKKDMSEENKPESRWSTGKNSWEEVIASTEFQGTDELAQ